MRPIASITIVLLGILCILNSGATLTAAIPFGERAFPLYSDGGSSSGLLPPPPPSH